MTANGWLQFGIYFVVLLVFMRPLGIYMAQVFQGKLNFLGPVENVIYRACGIRRDEEMTWREYTVAMLVFSFVSLLLMYFIERLQHVLPWNPQHVAGVGALLAWNTAVSFTTNTNWQAYTNDTTMSYFTQMAALAYHNFLSAAVGIAAAIALVRGIARQGVEDDWQFLGGYDAGVPVCAGAAVRGVCAGAGEPGRDSEFASVHGGSHAGRPDADDCAGAGGFAGSDQDAGDERGRVFQRE